MGTADSTAIEAISPSKTLLSSRRQQRSVELKRQIVGESFAEGTPMARVAWAPLLFEDEERQEKRRRRDPILPAQPSASARAKKRSQET